MKKTLLALAMTLPLSMFAAEMDANGIVTKKSNNDVTTTINIIEDFVKMKGLTLFNRINHQQNSKKAGGVDLKPAELIIFGNPKKGLKLLTKDPKAGLDLPLKILAYEGKDGNVYVSYRDIKFFDNIYETKGCKVGQKMSGMLDKLTDKATTKVEAKEAVTAH